MSAPPAQGSLGYASLLTPRDDLGGQLGAPEQAETPSDLKRKVEALSSLIRAAKNGGVVAFTGAGISAWGSSLLSRS